MVEFMNAVMERVGVRTVGELAQAVGMSTARDERAFYKWWRGEHRPRLDNVLPLMRAAGMLSPEAGRLEAAADGSRGRSRSAPGAVEDVVADLGETTAKGLREIRLRLDRIERRLPGEPPQRQPRRASGSK